MSDEMAQAAVRAATEMHAQVFAQHAMTAALLVQEQQARQAAEQRATELAQRLAEAEK